MRKTEIRNTTLVDTLIVCNDLPQDEIDQIEAFSGGIFDPQDMAVQIMSMGGLKWTCYDKETKEPLVVAGFTQLGATLWRSFMLASQKAWAEYGVEVTLHCRRAVKELVQNKQHIRLETMCLASRDKARAWYPKIGLEYESTLPAYGATGETAVLYTKTQGAKEN